MTKVYDLSAESGNRKSERFKAIARDQQVWIGIDDHKDNFVAAVLGDEDDGLLHRAKLPKGKEHVEGLIERLPSCEIWAMYEAGSTGYQLYRWLEECGVEAGICAPLLVPTKDGEDIKTDRRDAVKLAKCLRGGMLESIHVLTDQQYADREVVRSRKQLVQKRAATRKQIRSKLDYHGIDVPDDIKPSSWSNEFREWLCSEPADRPGLNRTLEVFVEVCRGLTEQIRELRAEIEQLAAEERYAEKVEWLTSTPGVGLITAMTFLVEIGDISRFDNCEEFAAFLGLVPSESSSGERIRRGGLVRGGKRRVRTALVEASWNAIGQDEGLREVYDRLKLRHGEGASRIAIVGVARRMALAFRAMLRDEEGWRSPAERRAKRPSEPPDG